MVRAPLLLAFLLVSGFASGQVPYTHAGLFKYTSPAGFTRSDGRVPPGRIGFFAAARSGYSANVMITIANAGSYTASKLGKETVAYMKANEKEVKVTVSSPAKLGGKDSFVIHMDRKLPNGMIIGQQQIIAINKGKALIFTFSALAKSYPKDKLKFEGSLKTFAWLN